MQTMQPSMTLKDAFRFLARSRYLLCIAVTVICYGIALNLIEVTWKTHLGLLRPNPQDYQDYMANFSLATGITTIVMMLLVANNVIRRFGWTVAALVTPVVLLITGVGFFSFILAEGSLAPLLARFDTTPLAAAVMFGFIQNVMSKSSKYSLFDPTKEMAYIPLDQESNGGTHGTPWWCGFARVKKTSSPSFCPTYPCFRCHKPSSAWRRSLRPTSM